MLLSATAATRVFTKTPLARASPTTATIVAGAVAMALVAIRAAVPRSVGQTTREKTMIGVTVASKSRR